LLTERDPYTEPATSDERRNFALDAGFRAFQRRRKAARQAAAVDPKPQPRRPAPSPEARDPRFEELDRLIAENERPCRDGGV
jgi:hypothetical protein